MLTQKIIDDLSYKVIGCAIEVQKSLGAGLLESVYTTCLRHELTLKGLHFRSEVWVPIKYKGIDLDAQLRLDLLVEDLLVVEIKAVENLLNIHEAQVLTYMKLLKKPKGILLNFCSTNIFNHGQKTFVNDYYAALPDK
ncbi:GxxExxY protein [Aridibaculum aurantiacum]|uniref:GxxExxY protein n=1 Tax=Aridibaculum aurantiacum TaxID=2810307 RepID=UPI001A960462|nr:GxxExxY protein [Aridibaculum aurantiacum]